MNREIISGQLHGSYGQQHWWHSARLSLDFVYLILSLKIYPLLQDSWLLVDRTVWPTFLLAQIMLVHVFNSLINSCVRTVFCRFTAALLANRQTGKPIMFPKKLQHFPWNESPASAPAMHSSLHGGASKHGDDKHSTNWFWDVLFFF